MLRFMIRTEGRKPRFGGKKRAKRLDIRIQKNTNKQRLKIQKRDKDTNSRMSEWEEKTNRDREEERG